MYIYYFEWLSKHGKTTCLNKRQDYESSHNRLINYHIFYYYFIFLSFSFEYFDTWKANMFVDKNNRMTVAKIITISYDNLKHEITYLI